MAGPQNDNEPVTFRRRDARRIQDAVRDFERGYRNGPPGRAPAPIPPGHRHARATTGISARSGVTSGSGTVQLYHLVGATLTADSPAASVPVRNVFAVAIANATWVIIASIDGVWSVVAADCP